MIRVRLQIGDGEILDTFESWGFIYMDADERTEAPIKKREATSYSEEAGEHLDPRTVQDAFDYKVKFLVECPNKNMQNANAKIEAFNKALYTSAYNSDIRTYKEVAFYNDYNRVKIVGLPEPIAQPTDFFRRQDGSALDCAQVELKIRVCDPTKCDFSTYLDEVIDTPDTTTDKLGIEWYNKEYYANALLSTPLHCMPELASFSRIINGETIYYYHRHNIRNVIMNIENQYHPVMILDPISLMNFAGLSEMNPPSYRTVWLPLEGENGNATRGDIFVTYPQMGYYQNGVWKPYDAFFEINDDLKIYEAKVENGDTRASIVIEEDVAIPLKFAMIVGVETSTATPAMMRKFTNLKSE